MMFTPVQAEAPAVSPLALADAKTALRVSGSGDDALIQALIDAYTGHLDGWSGVLGRALITQTWRQDFAAFCDRLSLPLAPVQSIGSVTYVDIDDATQTLSTSVYELLSDSLGAYVARKPNQSWPSVGDGTSEARVKVTFVAGYGDAAADVPAALRQAIALAVGKLYSFAKSDVGLTRDTVQGVGTQEWSNAAILTEVDKMVGYLIRPYRRVGF